MKSKVDKKDYCILLEGDRFPFRLSRKKMDRALSSLIQAFTMTGENSGFCLQGDTGYLDFYLQNGFRP